MASASCPAAPEFARSTLSDIRKQVPGHQIQVDVKFLKFEGKDGKPVKRNQYTAIDNATRVRALKIYIGTISQTRSTSLMLSSTSFRPASARCERTMAMNFRPNFTGMLKTWAFATPTSNLLHFS